MRGAFAALGLCAWACQGPLRTGAHDVARAPSSQERAAPVRLTLVGTNDVHGWVMTQEEVFPRGAIRFGGVAALSAYLEILRAENPGGVVLVDAGDLFQGTLMSNLTEGKVVIDAFNRLKYDAAAIGNHEFDYGPVGPVSAAVAPDQDAFGALRARMAQANFPMLSANIYEAATGQRPAWLSTDGSVIVERNGIRVGLLGLTTPQTPTVTLPINVASLRFGALGPEALAGAKRLREKGADVVIAVVHAGGKCTHSADPHDSSSCDLDTGEIFEMMESLPPGTFDAVVAGHTHAQIGHFIKGTPIIESFCYGRYFGLVELFIDRTTKKVLGDKTQIQSGIEVCESVDERTGSCNVRNMRGDKRHIKSVVATFRSQPIVPDASLMQLVSEAEKAVAALQHKRLGLELEGPLRRTYETESPMGSFLADSLRELARADIALMNPGGLRADLKEGPLTYGALYEVLPFDNTVATLTLTGDEVKRLMAAAFEARKGVFQVSGLRITAARCPQGKRLEGVTLPGGEPLEAKATYRVVMPDFLARGGDGLGPVLATVEASRVDFGANRPNLRDELVAFWQSKKSPLRAPPMGRIALKGKSGECREIGSKTPKAVGKSSPSP